MQGSKTVRLRPMKRTRTSRHARQTPDIDQLVRLAQGVAQSCCRSEDACWEQRLISLIRQLLETSDEATLTAALDHLYADKGKERSYDALADLIEHCCETSLQTLRPPTHTESDPAGRSHSLLLFSAPILAWSRYTIPAGPIAATTLANLRVQLQAHVFAKDVRIALVDYLFSPDQLTQSYCDTFLLTRQLNNPALHNRNLHLDPAQLPETAHFLSDTRYLLGGVVVPHDKPIFRWQEDDGVRDEALRQWQRQGGDALRPMLTGCISELLLPQSYHAACRNADRLSRPYSLRASVAYLGATLNLPARELRAVIAPFYDQHLEEYRIGFTRKNAAEVIHGMVWAMLDADDDASDVPAQIEALLRELGVDTIVQIEHRLPLEYCDDCGTPLYPNPEGEPVHAEAPDEQTEPTPRHLH
jgi:hypothetical protein